MFSARLADKVAKAALRAAETGAPHDVQGPPGTCHGHRCARCASATVAVHQRAEKPASIKRMRSGH
eukprot:1702666-Pyramimonas_sp.AAC.1